MRRMMVTAGLVLMLGLAGCERSGTVTTAAPTTQEERVRADLHEAGQELSQAATTVGQEVKPELQKVGEETRQGVHEAANKVSEMTATRP